MYNEELKMKYIRDNKDRNLTLEANMKRFFNATANYEEWLNKDLACFTFEEIVAYYKSLSITSLESLMIMNSQFKLYAEYCRTLDMLFDGQNHYMEMTDSVLVECLNSELLKKIIINRSELYSIVDSLVNPGDKFVILCLFEGVSGQRLIDISEFMPEQIKEDNIIKTYSGKTFKISNKLIDCMYEACEEYTYYTYSANGDCITRQFKDYDPHPFKSLANATKYGGDRYQQIYNRVIRIRGLCDNSPAITISGLLESGRIQMINDLIKPGQSAKQCIIENRNIIEEKYGYITSIARYLSKYGNYINSEQ